MSERVSVAAALRLVPSGARLVAAPGCAAPTTLLAALGTRCLERPDLDLHLYSGLQLDDQPFLEAVTAGALRYSTWHVTAASRRAIADGHADYVPLRLSDVPAAIERWGIDVALIRVSPPAADDTVSLGPSMTYSRAAVDTASIILAEVDPDLPATRGPTRLPVGRIAAMVDSQRSMPRYEPAAPGEVAIRIASQIVDLLPAAPSLQLGIGQVPEAVTDVLRRREVGSLRIVGLATEGVVDLAQAGLLAASSGPVPAVTAVEVMGGERLMRFVHDNPEVAVYPSAQGHDPTWLAEHFDRLISVNSAIEVDLSGQVNSEVVRGAPVAAIGGSADFVAAAGASAGGLSIIALPSTAAGGAVSRIVPRLGPGAVTTIPRHAYHLVVTEHGVADLRGRSERERVAALVAIADPAHRDDLERQAAVRR